MTKTLSSRERLSPQETKPEDLVSAQHLSDESSDTRKSVAESMQPPISGLQIIHATTGRIRIRSTISISHGDSDSRTLAILDKIPHSVLDTICQDLRRENGVTEVSINQQTGSLVVNFDENKLSLPQMLALLQQYGIDQPQVSPQPESKQDPFAAWKSPQFWKEQGISFIPTFTGLAVTGGLGISGLASIGVYFITANATRRVIDTLQHSASETNVAPSSQKAKSDHKSPKGANKTEEASLSKVEHKSGAVAQPVKIAYSVVHAIAGRIRLNVPRVARDRAYARRLERLLKTEPQVTNVRVNCDAASVAITYTSQEIPVSHWVDLIQLADETIPPTNPIKTTTQQLLQEPHQLAKPLESTPTKEQPTLETDSIWSDFKPPALGAALSLMANFSSH